MSPRVLCIEADPAVRERVRAALEAAGFAVDVSATGLEGIARARTLPPDLVISDVHLPDIEGADLAARLKGEERLARVPIIELGDTDEEHDVAIAAGADGFAARESCDGLCDTVRAVLDGQREILPDEGERRSLRALRTDMAARLETAVAGERRASDRLREVDRLRSAFMNNLAHELSTPLTPLSGYLRILQSEKLGALSAQQKRIVDSLVQSVTRLTRIVDNLSDFASLQAGQAPILSGPVEPDAMADEVVAELRSAAREARLNVTVTHAGGPPVLADARKLRQALMNLVSNAVKFSPHGGEVLVEVAREPGRLRFSVYDQGPGVTGDPALLFEPLHHAASRGGDEARQPGSGLGLPVARRIAEAHGGRVSLESPPRTQPTTAPRHFTGVKVTLEIPAVEAERPAAGPAGAGALSATR